jgi:hypothetical protein
MNLDVIAAVCFGLMAGFLFGLHVISSPRRHNWFIMPEYVRKGLLVAGATLMCRSVNLFTLPQPPSEPGHVNALALMATLTLTYVLGAFTVWAMRRYLPGPGWLRLHWAEERQRESEAVVPVMMTPREIEEWGRVSGLTVNAKPDIKLPDVKEIK